MSSVFDAKYHRQRVRDLAQEPPDEPTYCELKRGFAYSTNAEKAELVKDIVSFANTPLEHYGGFGYLIFGVTQDGDIPGVEDPLPGDPPSEIRNLLNKYLERPVYFEFVTTHVGDDGGEKKRLAAVVVPNSRRRPHVISRELQEQQGKKAKFFLREREVWVRKAGGRDRATAEDIDAMYEARFLSAARDATEPLARRIEDLEGELVRFRSASPIPSFGVSLPGEREPVQEATVREAIQVLFTQEEVEELAAELGWAKERAQRAQRERNTGSIVRLSTQIGRGPSPKEYAEYRENLRDWLNRLRDLVMVELMLSNTGEVQAEDVSVEIEIPPELTVHAELPQEKPERPVDPITLGMMPRSLSPKYTLSKQNAPEALLGPELDHDRRLAVWEIGRLYHGRPVRTDSDEEYVNGLLLDRISLEAMAGEERLVELRYTIRAANLRQPVEGALRLRVEPADPDEVGGEGTENNWSEG